MNILPNDSVKNAGGLGWVWSAGWLALILIGGARAAVAQQLLASGGDLAYVTNLNGTVYGIHIYTNVGTHTFTPQVPLEVEFLVVGGGGGGSTAGGGAGGVVTGATNLSSSPHSVTVGAGGDGVRGDATPRPVPAKNGTNSTAFGVTALGGGGGGGTDNKGLDGGSGGGAAASSVPANPSNGGAGLQPASASGGFGNAGGSVSIFSSPHTAAGGGGAGAQGQNQQSSTQAGKGGDGIESSITGDETYYGGGGGGGFWMSPGVAAAGGLGGGGSGVTSTNGTPGTGGGGGGGRQTTKGGNGGSGIVIVRYSALDPDTPTILNQAVTSVTAGSATFNGLLASTGSSACAVCVYWGTDTNAWAHTNWFNDGAVNSAWTSHTPFSTNIASGISPDTTYYYSYGASNAAANVVASGPIPFITGEVWIEKTSDASEIGPTPGMFTVHRASAATDEALTVVYTVGGTATPGVDYTPLIGTLAMPSGVASAVIEVTPVFDHFLEGPETVSVTLSPGAYVIGTVSNASLNIADAGLFTSIWSGGGAANSFLASNPSNWVGNTVPIAGDAIVLNATTNKNMTWNLNIPIQSWTQTEDYTGTVTVATVYPGQGVFTNFTILGDCVISNGVWTHEANPAAVTNVNNEQYRLHVTTGGNLIIGTGAVIHVTGKGYADRKGPGSGVSIYGWGGSYGGLGASGGPCYGSIVAPTNLGSGGQWSSGGGAIRMRIAGTLRHDGNIQANGADITQRSGAGGSIFLTAGALTGSGLIQANGGNFTMGTAGGGGRIALVVTDAGADFSGYTGSLQAQSGQLGSSAGNAGAGTIFRQVAADAPKRGKVVVDNNNLTSTGTTDVPPANNDVVGEVNHAIFYVTNAARLRLTDDFTVGNIWLDTANAVLDLGSNTLFVKSAEHPLGPGTVANYGAIVWDLPGTVFTFR